MSAPAQHRFPLLDVEGPCPVCGSEVIRPLHVYRNPKRRIASADELVLTGCEGCGVCWSSPLPTDEELDAYYSGPGGWEKRKSVAEAFSPEGRALTQRSLEAKYRSYGPKRDLLLERLELPEDGTPRVFDFGCGLGAWLDLFKQKGWETEGLEPGPIAAAISGDRHSMVDEIPTEQRYDMVILHHVLEHLKEPVKTLNELAAATKDGGYMFVSVPHFQRLPEHGKMGYVASGIHIFSYTVEGMRSVLAQAGFELLDHFDSEPWERDDVMPGARLRALARKTGAPRPTVDEPLRPAKDSLRGYAERQREKAEAYEPPLAERAAEQGREVYRAGLRRWRKARKRRAKKKRLRK